ncbi:hypothetical protein PCANB_000376 [Pneumocystis canis]|nr:hypothetical protein PCANB_000376 [Pneumocystis canis]
MEVDRPSIVEDSTVNKKDLLFLYGFSNLKEKKCQSRTEDMKEIRDPFFEAKENVSRKLSDAHRLYDLYLKISRESDIKSSMTLIDISKEFQEKIDSIEDDLTDLEEVVHVVENYPEKYGISNEESTRRRTFVNQIRNDLEQMQKDLNSLNTRELYAEDKSVNPFLYSEKQLKKDSILDSEFSEQCELLIMNEQDVQLDYVFGTVQNLREQASIMGRELAEQSELIEEVDAHVERIHERLKRGFKNIRRIISKNEG